MILLKLFISFLQIGLFSIGGGYAALPLIQKQIVDFHSWLSLNEFSDLITIAEMTPGPIAINSATFVGIRIASYPGAVVATIGCILPSLVIASLLYHFYTRFKQLSIMQSILSSLRPAVVGMIATAALSILQLVILEESASSINLLGCIMLVFSLIALRKYKLNPILLMVLCGFVQLASSFIF